MTRIFVATTAAALLGAAMVIRFGYGTLHVPELVAACVLSMLHGGAAFLIAKASLNTDTTTFMQRAMGWNALRALVVLLVILGLKGAGFQHYEAFVAAALTGYVVFLLGEVWAVHRATWHQQAQ